MVFFMDVGLGILDSNKLVKILQQKRVGMGI